METRCVQAANAILGEGPVWLASSQELLWVDIHRPAIFTFSEAHGQTAAVHLPERIGCTSPTAAGGLVLADSKGFALLSQRCGPLVRVPSEIQLDVPWRFNDGKVDRAGRFWAGTIDERSYSPHGKLYRLDWNLNVSLMETGLSCSNGIAWSPDDQIMYLVDSMTRTIWAYDFDLKSGQLGSRRVFAKLAKTDGVPDGLTVDSDGGVWIAIWDGWRVDCYAPDGQVRRSIPMPVQRPTSCMFGGSDLSTLFVTSASIDLPPKSLERGPLAGGLFAVETDVQGLEEPVFRMQDTKDADAALLRQESQG